MYDIPTVYSLTHYAAGFVAYTYPEVGIAFIAYQMFQLHTNRRLFVFEGKWKYGNSVAHTARKLAEFGAGYTLGWTQK
jgi:hypothetical protein